MGFAALTSHLLEQVNAGQQIFPGVQISQAGN
jgi:hypothetical protein